MKKVLNLKESEKLANISPSFNYSFSRLEREWKYTINDLLKK